MIVLKEYQSLINNKPLFAPVDLQVQASSCTVIMGTSGVGKSTLLNTLHNNYAFSGYTNINDNAFMVYQDTDHLFPWMSVRENLDHFIQPDVYMPLVNRWNLEVLLDLSPNNISGGQNQRFALIRAICSNKPILLCDEPLSALDSITGTQIARDFKEIVAEQQLSVLWVTHNWSEAKIVGDNIFYLSKRGLHEITNEDELYVTVLND